MPTDEEMERMLFNMELEYGSIRTDISDCFSRSNFEKVIRRLNFQGTPGYPYCMEATTIGGWLVFDGLTFNETRKEQLWLDVQKIINGDFTESYWRIFIKREPHKKSKAQQKRWRLIAACNLAIQVVWQMCFAQMNDKEIQNAINLPSQQGIILCGGSWKYFYRQWIENNMVYGTDASAWDWTVPGWMCRADLEFRTRLSYGTDFEQWKHVAASLYEDAFHHPRFYLTDGRVFRQRHWGIQKSGCVNTISTNSHGGAMLHCLYSQHYGIPLQPFAKTVGDDKLQTYAYVEHPEFYEKYGFVIKEVTSNCEFVGHRFTPDGPIPMYSGKHVTNLLYADDAYIPEILNSFLGLYANDKPMSKFWRELASELGIAHLMRSECYYQYWYHNPLAIQDGYEINMDRIGLDYRTHGRIVE